MKTFNLNFTQIEDDLKNGNRVTVKKLAEELGLSPLLIRNEITKFYGKDWEGGNHTPPSHDI